MPAGRKGEEGRGDLAVDARSGTRRNDDNFRGTGKGLAAGGGDAETVEGPGMGSGLLVTFPFGVGAMEGVSCIATDAEGWSSTLSLFRDTSRTGDVPGRGGAFSPSEAPADETSCAIPFVLIGIGTPFGGIECGLDFNEILLVFLVLGGDTSGSGVLSLG